MSQQTKKGPFIKKSQSSLHNFQTLGEQEYKDDINPYSEFFPLSKIKVEYKERISILDEYHSESKLRKSVLYGFFQLVFIFVCYFFVCHPIKKFLEEGIFLQSTLLEWVTRDVFDCFMLFPYMVIYMHTGYLLQKLRLNQTIEKAIQGFLIILCIYMFAFFYPIFLFSQQLHTSRAFVAMCTVACCIKLFSYIHENRQIRIKDPTYQVKYSEFIYFVIAPASIFQRKYPRNKAISYKFLLIKTVFSSLGFLGLYILTSDWLIPVIQTANQKDFASLLLELIEICFYFNLVTFYLIFECVLQVLAELTRFADREFYRDWWNSTSYSVFFQKSNRPVDDFGKKYIKYPIMKRFKLTEEKSDFFLGAFTAFCHEFVIIVITQAFTPFVLIILIIQIPFYTLFKKLEQTDRGNIVFWFIYLLSVPVVSTCYMKISFINITDFLSIK